MAIEFYCQGCGKQVRTLDNSAGKQGKCPQCGALMTIPSIPGDGATKTSGAMSANASSASQTPAKWKAETAEKTSDAPIEFDCPSCGQLVRTPPTSAGKKGRCPHCREVMQIPTANKEARGAAAARSTNPQPAAQKSAHKKTAAQKPIASPASAGQSEPIEFYCSSCASIVRTVAAAAGKKGKCPQCSAIVDIPLTSDPTIAVRSGGLTLIPSNATGLTPLPDSWPGLTPLPATDDLFLDSPGFGGPGIGGRGAPVDPFASSFGSPAPFGMDNFGSNAAWQAPAVSTNPYAAPVYAPAPSYGQLGSDGSEARTATRVCGILMAVFGGFYTAISLVVAIFALSGTAFLGFASQERNLNSSDQARLAGMMVGMMIVVVLAIAWNITILIGGIQLARLRKWGLAMTASVFCVVILVFSLITLNPCSIIFNVPMAALGIWGIIMLCNASVKRSFR